MNCLCYGKTFQLSFIKKAIFWGLPWRSSGWDSELPLQGARVQSLVGELGSRVPHGQKKKAILKKKNLFNLFLALLGLRCCARAFSSCSKRGLLFVAARGLLIAVASLVVEHGL